jgi:hypothetical protein
MGYGTYFPAHQVGGQPELWDIRSYGVSGVWVKRSSTVSCFSSHFGQTTSDFIFRVYAEDPESSAS